MQNGEDKQILSMAAVSSITVVKEGKVLLVYYWIGGNGSYKHLVGKMTIIEDLWLL